MCVCVYVYIYVCVCVYTHTQKQNLTCGLYAHTMLHGAVLHYTLVVSKICWILKCLQYGLAPTCVIDTHHLGFKWLQ
jgi:hypothetical protein